MTPAIPMTAERFLQGLTWPQYLEQMTVNRQRVEEVLAAIHPTETDIAAARAAANHHERPLALAVLTEDWCGDAVVNVPVVVRFAEAVPGTHLRLFIRSQHPDLEAAYAREEVLSIPTVSFFDARWREVARWVEHSREARQRKAEWMARYPEAEGWRRSTDPEDEGRWQRLLARRLVAMIGWYREGLWRATWEEMVSLLAGQWVDL